MPIYLITLFQKVFLTDPEPFEENFNFSEISSKNLYLKSLKLE